MGERDALMANILAHPDEDLPRLVFADWLDEQGNDVDAKQATYIRQQVESHSLIPHTRRWQELKQAAVPHADIVKEQHKLVAKVYERGFLHGVTMHSKQFVQHGEELFTRHPIRAVKFVKLNSARGTVPMAELAQCPTLARLTSLDFTNSELTLEDYETLAASPHVQQMTTIILGGDNRYAVDGAIILLRTLPKLNHVSFVKNWSCTLAQAELFWFETNTAKIRTLNLSGTPAVSSFMPGVLACLHFQQLEVLHLDGVNEFTLSGRRPIPAFARTVQEQLLSQAIMFHLHTMTFLNRRLRGQEIHWLVTIKDLPKLTHLNLAGNKIGIRAAEALAAAPWATNLRVLDLRYNDLEDKHLDHLGRLLPECEIIG